MLLAMACEAAIASEPGFNRDIRPILSENCFLCHGQDPEHRGGDLRLDLREQAVAVRDGAAAIVPGDPENSEIIRRILSKDPEVVMPPPDAHMPAISPAQIDTLKRWIKAGATYEPHWAFVPPRKTEIPAGANP
ncbi:MAG TPA: c-type cytochrome domain-containing protein, partial [Luteolibacter sp.]|nr:c-type cytochrome domain-containing protein [Luteolibacter sp.]